MTVRSFWLLNRPLFGRHVQVAFHPLTWQRGRGFYPQVSRWWPIFHYWLLGPVELRVFSPEASRVT